MTDIIKTEKRQLPRILCSDTFSQSCVELNSHIYTAQSINYNRHGMTIFCSDRFPEITYCQISFRYQSTDAYIEIEKLSCIIAWTNETEIGNQYGIKFQAPPSNGDVDIKLKKIETGLKSEKKNGDRYGLIS
jgi:hypothetical protein